MVALVIPFNPSQVKFPANMQVARAYAAVGVCIFPCSPTKRPLVKWKDEATTDEDQIIEWWTTWPDAIVGLPCGSNRLLVIDCDRHPGQPDGVEAFKKLVDEHGLPEGVVIVETQGGGRHYIFRQPDGDMLGNSTGNLPAGIDVRGDGGFIIAPGSVLPDGRCWREAEGSPALINMIEN